MGKLWNVAFVRQVMAPYWISLNWLWFCKLSSDKLLQLKTRQIIAMSIATSIMVRDASLQTYVNVLTCLDAVMKTFNWQQSC